MTDAELCDLLDKMRQLPHETELVEFKVNYIDHQKIGESISALANSACYNKKDKAYLVFGIEDGTHNVVGTKFKPKQEKIGNEPLENWLVRLLNPRIYFAIHELIYDDHPVVLFEIDAAKDRPVRFQSVAKIRIGSCTQSLKDYPDREGKIWKSGFDWSAQICEKATIDDLDPEAIRKARKEFLQKNPRLSDELSNWDDLVFLNKAKLAIRGMITITAIILLGKPESDHFLSPSVAQMTWELMDNDGNPKDYHHFGPPFLLNVQSLFAKIRNLNYRFMPSETLFPIEITEYDPWVIREALHNCIAHQDYELRGRIAVVEKPDELIFTNLGDFIPGSVEAVIERDFPPEVYRNRFLAQAMVNLNMIDTIGGGIKKMFQTQRKRYFPLPDYDLGDPQRVVVKIQGKIINENYTRLLITKTDLSLESVMLLDKVQKRKKITKEECQVLREDRLIEGRYPNVYISAPVASVFHEKAKYIKNRGFNKKYYQDLITEFIKKNGSATRSDINDLLLDKLPDILTRNQKSRKINHLLSEMSAKLGLIRNIGSKKGSQWILAAEK